MHKDLHVVMDRAFDAVCAERAGMRDLHDEILRKLRAAHPELLEYIEQLLVLYGNISAEISEPREKYLKEYRGILHLRYR